MEHTPKNIPDYKKKFFKQLSSYLNTTIYYHGSVNRYDFFNESDIDIDIFTENENEMISKICYFLKFNRDDVKKFVWKLHINNEIVYGYKLLYHDIVNDFYVDIEIFNEKDKKNVLIDHKLTTDISFFYIVLLYILKFIYYKIQIIDWATYSYIKKNIIGLSIGGDKSEYTIIGEDKDKRVPFKNLLNLFIGI